MRAEDDVIWEGQEAENWRIGLIKLCIGLLGFVVFGGLIFELLSRIFLR
jgi:hypothetical protein